MKTTNSKSDSTTIFVYVLMLIIVSYMIILFFYPDLERYFYFALIFITLYGFLIYLIKRNRYAKILKACELVQDGIYPKHMSSKKTPYGVDETFSLVPGMCLSDFNKKSEPISQYLDKKIEFEYSKKNIIMKVFNDENS